MTRHVLLTVLLCLGASLQACDNNKIDNANSVIIDDGVNVRIMGAIKFGMGGFLGGTPPEPEPGGPIIVYIFKNIPQSYQDDLVREAVPFKNNAAYLWPENGAFDLASMKAAVFISDIDPSLSNESLAESFGASLVDE